MSRERLFAALSPNGHRVHLANGDGQPVCGSKVIAVYRARARVTCPGCRVRRAQKARRLDGRPLVVGVNHEPFYAAMRRALESGASQPPRVRVTHWPVLGKISPSGA